MRGAPAALPAAAALLAAPSRAAAAPPQCTGGRACPHIFMVVIDDLGWNNVPWHNPDLEAHMPVSLALARGGVEIDRHYAYHLCSPTRSSLISGRLPFHVNQVNLEPSFATDGIARGMTTMPRKLKDAGYATHAVGKWDCGCATLDHTPHGRGFDTHLGYFNHAEDHWTQRQCRNGCMETVPNNEPSSLVDLWLTDGPAFGRNGSAYGDVQFTRFIVDAVRSHPLAQPMFAYVAWQNNHAPLQAPDEYVARFPASWTFDRRHYAAMGAVWDGALGNITSALQERGMWAHTLLALTADNGGPVYPSPSNQQTIDHEGWHCGGANNYPLFGGKTNDFEGGVRVAAFVAGGALPGAVRGTKVGGYSHVADWLATFCAVAGVDPADPAAAAAGLPQVDSLDLWPLISGANATSPRVEIPLSVEGRDGNMGPVSALISGDYKLMGGTYLSAFRQEPAWPTSAACCAHSCWQNTSMRVDCGTAASPTCLFNIQDDPTETRNIFAEQPKVAARLAARLAALRSTRFDPQQGDTKNAAAAKVWRRKYGGFIGPWMDLPTGEGAAE